MKSFELSMILVFFFVVLAIVALATFGTPMSEWLAGAAGLTFLGALVSSMFDVTIGKGGAK